MTTKTPTVLIILDGWGYREASSYNAIHHANTPTWDRLMATKPHRLISSSGLNVGLPEGQMGNSEVGHMSLGSGRIIYQQITRIDKAIEDGEFFENSAYCTAIDKAIADDGAVHIMGLLSNGGVHSHEHHIHAAIKLAAQRGCKKVYLHAFLDGRDTPPQSAESPLSNAQKVFDEIGCGGIASVVGRYFALDRDNRWDRVEKAHKLLCAAEAEHTADSALDALAAAYDRGENDEFVAPTLIPVDGSYRKIEANDAVLFMNFRADRAREITQAITDANFDGFDRGTASRPASFVMTSNYADSFDLACAFPSESLKNSLGEYMESLDKTQLRIAETEKYAHVTFFFSGGREALYKGEERVLVPSPDVATYDLQPEMSAPEVTEKLCKAITDKSFDLIVCNYANGDMVGHTGDFDAAVKAAEAIDIAITAVEAAVNEVGGHCLITADHGNCEQMRDENNERHTQHTTELVPFIYVGQTPLTMRDGVGSLSDVAPTILKLMSTPQPEEMTGESLVEF